MRDEVGGDGGILLGCATYSCNQITYSCNKYGQIHDKDSGNMT